MCKRISWGSGVNEQGKGGFLFRELGGEYEGLAIGSCYGSIG